MKNFTHLGWSYAVVLMFGLSSVNAQDVRSIDGSNNNLANPTWGATHSQMTRVAPSAYADSISAIAHPDWTNERTISNEIFSQADLINDPMQLSDYCWTFGQFLDHDITFVPDQANAWSYIQVPSGDPYMDPQGFGFVLIPMRRSQPMPGTGTGIDNPREHFNEISAFIDGSNVYGSDQQRADWLRSFEDGKLKTSTGNLLPWNTLDGEYDSEIDPDAPHMDDAVGMATRLFVAGDIRANEQPLLIGFHTLFVREHNRLCDELKTQHPDWTDEQLYQHARRIVGGLLQSITYEQYLPAMGVHPTPYGGYDETVDPSIFNIFSAAAFRLGHTLLNGNIQRMDNEGNDLGALPLHQVFFNPDIIQQSGGIECFLKGMGAQVQQALDGQMIDDVRNFLFGPPPAGGLDLAAINIRRGRERGLPGFNAVREAFGLPVLQDWSDITDDAELQNKLALLYTSPDDLDAWVGMVCEKPMDGALFGTTIMEIMMQQFDALRQGDRFYYENDPGLSAAEKDEIKNTMLVDIIKRNTNIPIMQDDVFQTMPHGMLCTTDSTEADLTINLALNNGTPLNNVEADVYAVNYTDTVFQQNFDGQIVLENIPTCVGYDVRFSRDNEAKDGVTALDIVTLRLHILGLNMIDSPFLQIAGDANRSGSISALDIIALQRVILGLDTEWANADIWEFYRADCLTDGDCDRPAVMNLLEDTVVDYVAVKTGDVNISVDPNVMGHEVESRSVATVDVHGPALVQEGELLTLQLVAEQLTALQGTLNYQTADLEFVGTDLDANSFVHENGQIAFVSAEVEATGSLFQLQFKARRELANTAASMHLSDDRTTALAYDATGTAFRPQLRFVPTAMELATLLSAEPNPVGEQLTVNFSVDREQPVRIVLSDVTGREYGSQIVQGTPGMNSATLDVTNAPSGTLVVRVVYGEFSETLRVIKS